MPLFETVLVANRGEIAVRVIRTLRALGIRSVAVYSDADVDARHVMEADLSYRLGPAPARESYLSIDALVAACAATGAEAVHPGYGFLSESAAFAAALEDHGIAFIGPSSRAIEVMGDKITAKNAVEKFSVPVIPGIARPGLSNDELVAAAPEIGYPIMVKPSAGGGGKGMRVVTRSEDLPPALASARREASSSFGDDTLFLERFVQRPRHIEVQVLADSHGNVIHLGERECSLQRRHQKVIEEAPSPLLDEATRARIGVAACDTARSVDYTGAGTVEFIVSADSPDEFFFMEMNTRLQVEHPVTELVTGVDLVEWQVRIAAGEVLTLSQDDIVLTGHAIEARVYAEDPGQGFLPTGGLVLSLHEPTGPGVRVDSGLCAGTNVGSDYDPMLSKIIAHGADRDTALARLDRALASTAVLGLQTNVEFLRHLLENPRVRAGDLDTELLDMIAESYQASSTPDTALLAAAALVMNDVWAAADPDDLWTAPSAWRISDPASIRVRFAPQTTVTLTGTPAASLASIVDGDGPPRIHDLTYSATSEGVDLTVDGVRANRVGIIREGTVWVHDDGTTYRLERASAARRSAEVAEGSAEITSPMPGSVIAVHVEDGAVVEAGTALLVVEAMKMEHAMTAPVAGSVKLLVKSGEQVAVGQSLALITAPDTDDDIEGENA